MGTLARWHMKTKWSLNKMSVVRGQDQIACGHAVDWLSLDRGHDPLPLSHFLHGILTFPIHLVG